MAHDLCEQREHGADGAEEVVSRPLPSEDQITGRAIHELLVYNDGGLNPGKPQHPILVCPSCGQKGIPRDVAHEHALTCSHLRDDVFEVLR